MFNRTPKDFSNPAQDATNLLINMISQANNTSGALSLRQRDLAFGDFEAFNNLLRSATLSLSDAQVSTEAVGITLDMDMTNLRCTNVAVGDILITYQKESDQRFSYGIEIFDLDVTCYLDFRFSYGFFRGNGQADAFTNNNQAKTTLAFSSSDFNSSPPSSSSVEFCEALINIVDLDIRGDFIVSIVNTFETLIRGTIENQVQGVVCEQLQALVRDFGTNYLGLARNTLDPYLNELSSQESDPLYAEQSLSISSTKRLLDFGDNESVVVGWFHKAINTSKVLLGTTKLDESTGLQDLGINSFLRQNFLDVDRALIVNVDSFVENAQLYNAEDKLTATTITVDSVKIFGFDTLTQFSPLSDMGRYTVTNKLFWELITIELELTIDVEASKRDDSILSNPNSPGFIEKIKVDVGVENIDAAISLLLAIDQDILGNLELASLSTLQNIAPCLLSSLFQVNVTALDVQVLNIREPVLSGFISAGVNRLVSETIKAAFIMYQATILKALPKFFQTTIRDTVNQNIIQKYLTTEGNADCPKDSFGEGPIDFRDFFLMPNMSAIIGGTGSSQYGDLGATLKTLLQDQMLSMDSDGLPKLNSFLVRPLTEAQSGIPGALSFPGRLFNIVKDDMTNPLVLTFIQRFRLAASDFIITNLDTVSTPMAILEPSPDPHVITNTLTLGPISGKDLTISMQLLWAIEGENSPLDMRHSFHVSLSIPSSSIVADLRAMIDSVELGNLPLKDLLEMNCWLAMVPVKTLNSEGKRSDSNAVSSFSVASLLLRLTDLSAKIDCVSCSTSGVSILSEVLQLQKTTGSWSIVGNRMKDFVEDIITSDWFQLQIDQFVLNAPRHCPHNSLYDKNLNTTKNTALRLPNISRKAVETVLFAGGLGAELAILAFAETHLEMNIVPTGPLGPQANLSPTVRANSLNWTDLSGTIGRFADIALDEARSYWGGMVEDKERGNKDLGLNILFRSYFLDEKGSWTIPLDDVGFVEVGLNLTLLSIRIKGLDTLTKAVLFQPLDAQTVGNELHFAKLSIELDLLVEIEEEAGSPDNITIAISIGNLNLTLALLLAIHSEKIAEMKLSSLLRTKNIVPCILAAVDALEVTQLLASAGSFNATITGFLETSVQTALDLSLKTIVDTYQIKILSAIPAVFQKTARGLFNRIIPAYIGKWESRACTTSTSGSKTQLVDFRDLFLPPTDALKAGGRGDSPYGNLPVLIKQLLNTEFLDSGAEKGIARLNEVIIQPLTSAQSGINGTFAVKDTIASLTLIHAARFGIDTIQLALANMSISNLDTVGSPFIILEPNVTKGTLLNNKAALAFDSEPMYGSFRLLLAVDGDPLLSMRNEIEVGIQLSDIEAISVFMLRMREMGLFDFPLRDIANLDCWLATLTRPELDDKGFRLPGSDPGLVFDYLGVAAQVLHLNFSCTSCTSSGLAALPEVVSTLQDAGTVEDLLPQLLSLSSDLLRSDYVQVLLDRLLVKASLRCPHSPNFGMNTPDMYYEQPAWPMLTGESLETIIYAATIVVESSAVLLAKSHENSRSSKRDPLSAQNELSFGGNVRLLDFLSLNGSVGSWVDSAMKEANKYLAGETIESNGMKDLGINVFMRSAFLDDNGSFTIAFDDTRISEGSVQVFLKQIRIVGLDTFTNFNAFDAIAPQTIQNVFGWKELSVAFDIFITLDGESTSESRTLDESKLLTVTFAVNDIDLSLAILLALDQDRLGSLQMGSMLKASKILPCILSASKRVEISELAVSIGWIHGLSLTGFLSPDVNEAVTRSSSVLLEKYRDTLIDTMPAIFDSTVRTLANNWLSSYQTEDRSIVCAVSARTDTRHIDLRDLLLPEQASQALGGSGDGRYGNIFQSLLEIVNEKVLTVNEADGTSAVNSLLISPLTKAQSLIPGTFWYKGDLFNTGTRIAVGGFNAKIDWRVSDARIENLDSCGAPLSILNPLLGFPNILNHTASFGIGEKPLRFTFRLLFSLLGDKDMRLKNEVVISLDLSAVTVIIGTLLNIREAPFFDFPLRDFQNINCWMATLPKPLLDSKGLRKPDSSLSAALAHLALSLKKLNLNVSCVSCTSPKMESLSKLLSTSEAVEDVTEVANGLLDYVTKLLSGEFLQFQIDRMLANAPARCPHTDEYQPNFIPFEYGTFEAVVRKEESTTFFRTIAIVMGCLVACTVLLSIVTNMIVKRRSSLWVVTLSPERVNLIQQLQAAELEKEAELNHLTTSMFHSADIPLWVRYFIPCVLVINVGFFLSGHLNLGASVNIVAELAGEKIIVENFFEFSIAQSTIDIWKAGGKELAILIVLVSGVWPYTKQLVTLALWFLPPNRVSCTRRGNTFLWLDALAKWSMVDIFVLIVSITAFRITIKSPDVEFLPKSFYSINLLVAPKWGLYANMIAQLICQINSHFIIHYHRHMIESALRSYERRVIGGSAEGGWNDDDDQIGSPGSNTHQTDEDKSNLRSHAFSRPHRGESDKLLVQDWVNTCLVLVSLLLSLLILVGCILPSFSLEVLGIVGIVVESGQRFEEAVLHHSVFTIIQMLMNEARFLGGINNYIGLASLSILLILTVLIVPMVQSAVLLCQWFTPLTRRQRKRTNILLESLQAWQYAEVYVLSLLVAAWQLGPVSEFMINTYCDSLSNTFATLAYFGIVSEQDAQCFRVQASIESATHLLIVAAILLFALNSFVMRAVHQNEFDNSAIVQSLQYVNTNGVEECPINEKELEGVRHSIRPVPVLFTDSYRWVCRRQDRYESRVTITEYDENAWLGITETFMVSAKNGKGEKRALTSVEDKEELPFPRMDTYNASNVIESSIFL